MGSNEITIDGMDELLEKLDKLEVKVENKLSKEAINAGAEIIKDSVIPKIPRSEVNKEHAADHILISPMKKKDGIKYVLIGQQKGDNSKFYYLKFWEFGFHRKTKDGGIEFVQGKSMFGSTIAEKGKTAVEAMKQILLEGLKKL
jgi:HK97 gp10 family phage protein